jgi:hypothetical protein
MIEFVKKLRKKPEHKRKQWLFFSTLGITFVVVLMWVFMLRYEFDATPKNDVAKSESTPGPFTVFKNIFNNAKQSANALKSLDGYKGSYTSDPNDEELTGELFPVNSSSAN